MSAETAIEYEAVGIITLSRVTTLSARHIVSPVLNVESFATAQTSPAHTSFTSVCFAPKVLTILPRRSLSPVLAFLTVIPCEILPLTILKKLSFPINGSATVLKQIAASGAFSSTFSSTGSPSESIAYSDFGAGQQSFIKSSNISTPTPVKPERAKTGTIEPSAIPMVKPLSLSSLVSALPSKYFSINSSSVPATASANTSLIASKRGASSCKISASTLLTPLYV